MALFKQNCQFNNNISDSDKQNRVSFKDFLKFMRPETSLFITGMAVTGFLLFNPLSIAAVFLIFAVFFLSASSYALNYITDKKEDAVNNNESALAGTKKGYAFFCIMLAASFAFSLFLEKYALYLYLALAPLVMLYSLSGIKKVFLAKNLYVGATMAAAALIGAFDGDFGAWLPEGLPGGLPGSMLYFAAFPFLFGIIINLLGDIRGQKGDMEAGIMTIPVLFGRSAAKGALYCVFALFFAMAIALGYWAFYPILPFLLIASVFLKKNEFGKTRASVLSSFIFLPFFLLLIKSGWL